MPKKSEFPHQACIETRHIFLGQLCHIEDGDKLNNKLHMLLKLSEVFHQPGVGGKLSHLPASLQEVVAGKDHGTDEHVGVDQVVVHHDHALLQLGLAV